MMITIVKGFLLMSRNCTLDVFILRKCCLFPQWPCPLPMGLLKNSWSPNSTYLYWDFYLLSWWWQPLWSGGLLFQLPVQLKKASQLQFLFKISVSCTQRLSRSKEIRKKLGKTLQKTCLFQASQPSGSAQIGNSWNEPAQIRNSWNEPAQIRNSRNGLALMHCTAH